MEGETLFGSAGNAHMAYSSAFLALAWHERGDRERAWEALRRRGERPGVSDGERFWLISQAELLLADGDYGQVARIAGALATTRPPDTHPLWSPWRSLQARAARGRAIGRLRHASRAKSWRSLAAAGRRGS